MAVYGCEDFRELSRGSDLSNSFSSLELTQSQIVQYEKELKRQAKAQEKWVIASDDGINSRMYRSKSKGRKDCYTFNLSEAKICSSEEAYQISTMMTKRSRVGRVWYPLRIK